MHVDAREPDSQELLRAAREFHKDQTAQQEASYLGLADRVAQLEVEKTESDALKRNLAKDANRAAESLAQMLAPLRRTEVGFKFPRKLSGPKLFLPWRRRKLHRLREDYRAIALSALFDSGWYVAAYPDVGSIDPAWHYLRHGGLEGRAAGPHFDGAAYLRGNPDVAASGQHPLLHYIRFGVAEGRKATSSATAPMRTPLWRDQSALTNIYQVVPYYLNPYRQEAIKSAPGSVAVHLHLFYQDMTVACIGYLLNIPFTFDLFISIPNGRNIDDVRHQFHKSVPNIGSICVEIAPNRGRDIGPFIIQFGKRLLAYDYVAHFHTKKSPQDPGKARWFESVMDTLCGSRAGVDQIFDLFGKDAMVVYPAGDHIGASDITGWSNNREVARIFLSKYTDFDINDFPNVEFPQGAMFWARTACLKVLLSAPLWFEDFPAEPIPVDGTLAHALERLILIFTTKYSGRNYRIESPALSRALGDYFETQYDYSNEIQHDTVKVLAYYLPQFHPTVENDVWHGVGFTEWHKVRAANPLFYGHYQQHVPHPDIGYYDLNSPEQLRVQSELMRQAGVHGLIFYHYWFSGKLILEHPAKMLLDSQDINIKYCFCWANENWTRRWDGNEREILLAQSYSAEDAAAFIRYLIPFFKDPRYIKVEDRPVIFVYRPSSIDDCKKYLAIWRDECERSGLKAPYVVATLTRGARSPHHYGMDAAAERVLHDWTDGAVADIRADLHAYWPLHGSVLDYNAVAEHYMSKRPASDLPTFRALVPAWDNTARYGSEAYLVHNFTTRKMQDWLTNIVESAERDLPTDRRFVLVNAWNEWAEGAHLEPDVRFGYGYLNVVGRALSGYKFDAIEHMRIRAGVTVKLSVGRSALERLTREAETRRKFLHCLASSSVFELCEVWVENEWLDEQLRNIGVRCTEAPVAQDLDFALHFSEPCLFPSHSIERLVQMGLRYHGFLVCGNILNDPDFISNPAAPNFDIDPWRLSEMQLQPKGKTRGFKVCCQAPCFRLGVQNSDKTGGLSDRISTIVRYHRGGDRRLLFNALFSLLAQVNCSVALCLAVQDVSGADLTELQRSVDRLPWADDCRPLIRCYNSSDEKPDLRSLMLVDMLKTVGRGYVAFLDFDDILFPDAYCALLQRLKATGKNASFARVYSTTFEGGIGRIIKREKVYNYGHTYDDYFKNNHAPLHSFLLDLNRIDLSEIVYFDDMKYMEDYYLTLQIFTPDDTDWGSLNYDIFIGDYIHRSDDQSNTLAVLDAKARTALLNDDRFRQCKERIDELRQRMSLRHRRSHRVPAAGDER